MTTRLISLSLPHAPRQRRAGILKTLLGLREVMRQRRALAALDARLLDDLGLTEAEVRREAARAPWDVPDDIPWDVPNHWRA
ncbi:DUF1127 domain-containing protein [Palleronia sp. KMU-117]|uniref:DUF1127 domain-containing protein n=1 Tax=Palleronia sp. KMU-117 TaxID=3434108 RepID=UPI003D75CDA5